MSRDTQAPSSPTTEAGRALLSLLREQAMVLSAIDEDQRAILAIEQQARDEGRREAVPLREALQRIASIAQANWQPMDGDYETFYGELAKAHGVAGLNASESPPLMPPQHCACGRELPCYDNHPLTACPDCGHDVDHTTPCPNGCPLCVGDASESGR